MKKHLPRLIVPLLLGLSAAAATQFPITSTFADGDADGWVTMNQGGDPRFIEDIVFEEPGLLTPPAPPAGAGVLSFYDMDAGAWGFVNTGKFAGDLSAAFGGTLSFRHRWDTFESPPYDTPNPEANVVICGLDAANKRIAIIHHEPFDPAISDWHVFSQPLTATGGWYWKDEATVFAPPDEVTLATDAQIRQVLANVTFIYILGEYITGDDRGYLDDVTITASQPTLAVGAAVAGEHDGFISFPVTLSAATTTPIELTYQTEEVPADDPVPARATLGADFVGLTNTLHLPAGAVGGTITVPLIDDSQIEAMPESFRLRLTAPAGVALNQMTAVGTINDDDIESYWTWVAANGLTRPAAEPDVDTDGDGVSNRRERLLAADPSGCQAGDGRLVPVAGGSAGRQRFEFRLQAGPRIRWILETSGDLGAWQVLESPADFMLIRDVSGSGLRELLLEVPLSPGPRRFWRVRVEAF